MIEASDPNTPALLLGWREWVVLPELTASTIKAKIDTGARSSALHASDLEIISTPSGNLAKFRLLARKRKAEPAVAVLLPVLEYREVRSSNGIVSRRPVVTTTVHWRDLQWPVEFTLIDRRAMRFRLLLGRHALRRFRVDPSRSFLGGKPG